MSQDHSKRFTDREVALILKNAADLDEVRGSGPAKGLSRADLEEIAAEVGISLDSIGQAIDMVGAEAPPTQRLAFAPRIHSEVHGVEGELDEAELSRLMHVIDERAPMPGSVSEALGSVRWTGADRFRSMQVAITPRNGETSIQVTEKAAGRLARVIHLMPGAFGLMFASSFGASAGLSSTLTVGLTVACLLGGLTVGRAVWNRVSRKSQERVRNLAAALTQEAREAVDRRPSIPEQSSG